MPEKMDKIKFWRLRSARGGNVRARSPEEAEMWLLDQFARSGGKEAKVVEQLLRLYLCTGQSEKAHAATDVLCDAMDGNDNLAFTLFMCGQFAEGESDYAAAEKLYRRAHSLHPPWLDASYWIMNNLGFCLNKLGRFPEAGEFLKRAIAICSHRSNAYKNMGICFQGRALYEEAAQMYVAATKVNPADRRALVHLIELLKARPELLESIPGILKTVADCREAVERARAFSPDRPAYWKILMTKREDDPGMPWV